MFLHYILNEDEMSLISRFYKSQVKSPYKNDWCTTVQTNLDYLEIMLTHEQIKECSKDQFKTLVNKCCEEKALLYLNQKKEKLSKVKHIKFDHLKKQKYFEANTTNLGKFTFLVRSRMLDLGDNYQNKSSDLNCPVCEDKSTRDSQSHLMVCPKLNENQIAQKAVHYEDIFEDDFEKQMEVARIMDKNFRKRKEILRSKKK